LPAVRAAKPRPKGGWWLGREGANGPITSPRFLGFPKVVASRQAPRGPTLFRPRFWKTLRTFGIAGVVIEGQQGPADLFSLINAHFMELLVNRSSPAIVAAGGRLCPAHPIFQRHRSIATPPGNWNCRPNSPPGCINILYVADTIRPLVTSIAAYTPSSWPHRHLLCNFHQAGLGQAPSKIVRTCSLARASSSALPSSAAVSK